MVICVINMVLLVYGHMFPFNFRWLQGQLSLLFQYNNVLYIIFSILSHLCTLVIAFVWQDLRKKVPILYFWYAEMEIAISSGNNSDSVHRAIYILSCLGSNVKYTSFIGPISRPQVLRARQGFKEKIRSLRSAFACGGLKEESVALICSASLFESMTSGYSSGLQVIEETFPMALSGLSSFSFSFLGIFQALFFCSRAWFMHL